LNPRTPTTVKGFRVAGTPAVNEKRNLIAKSMKRVSH